MDDAKLELSREWLRTALDDLKSARKLARGDDPIYWTAIYHCQQAGENALKGFLVYRDRPFEKTHDLMELIEEAAPIDPGFSILSDDADLLTPYASRHRYPDEQSMPGDARFRKALAAAERVYRFVLAKHPELDPEKP